MVFGTKQLQSLDSKCLNLSPEPSFSGSVFHHEQSVSWAKLTFRSTFKAGLSQLSSAYALLTVENQTLVKHLLRSFTAVSVLRGYGFVQFDSEEDARRAVDGEAGGLLKGSKIGRLHHLNI